MIVRLHIDSLVVDAAPGADVKLMQADLVQALSQGFAQGGLAERLLRGGAIAEIALPWPAATSDLAAPAQPAGAVPAANGRLGERIGAALLNGLSSRSGAGP